MNAPMHHFVCDRCANYWQAYRSKRCPACGHSAIWQFDDERHARQHAADIREPARRVEPL